MRRKRQFAILGMGRFGISLAETLESMGYEVLCVDVDENLVSKLAEQVSRIVSFDIRDARAFDQVGIESFDTVIISAKKLEASLMATMLCKERNVPDIVVKAIDERHAEMAKRMGATQIIFSERDMARRLALHLVAPNVQDYIEINGDIKIINFNAPEDLWGKTLRDANLRERYALNVIAIIHEKATLITPPPSYEFCKGDKIFAIGSNEVLAKFRQNVLASMEQE
ncbi:K(+)-uptake protein KtrA [Anaerovibrio sp. JC8]|uniref:potassium channel family protein n=1 Tax=Anaerovibrio sp. JC8 TaxID=1240085 RepID=UPI000A0C4ADE|nr:TrkA family potassium uptake protein [Anaerovibrio sp. JC8]ORT99820.1 K(+)-uptake protein KtrA [Anaerovibrio sp. JC8]